MSRVVASHDPWARHRVHSGPLRAGGKGGVARFAASDDGRAPGCFANALGGRRILLQLCCGPDGTAHELSPAVRADTTQHLFRTCQAKRPLKGTDHWLARRRGQVSIAASTVRPELQHQSPSTAVLSIGGGRSVACPAACDTRPPHAADGDEDQGHRQQVGHNVVALEVKQHSSQQRPRHDPQAPAHLYQPHY
jgi:hypothetical protein